MERLTRPITAEARADYERCKYIVPVGEYTTGNYHWMFSDTDEGRAVQKLAAYENTGLEPNEIMGLQNALNNGICNTLLKYEKSAV